MIDNSVFWINNNKTTFSKKVEEKKEEVPKVENDSDSSKTGKVLIASSLLALAGVGVYLATRGKKGTQVVEDVIANGRKNAEEAVNEVISKRKKYKAPKVSIQYEYLLPSKKGERWGKHTLITSKKWEVPQDKIASIKSQLTQKRTINAEMIDRQFKTSNEKLDSLNEFYRKKEAWETLCRENPQEAMRIKKERALQKKLEKQALKQQELEKNTIVKDGVTTVTRATKNGKIQEITGGDFTQKIITNGKTTTNIMEKAGIKSVNISGARDVQKVYVKEDGKYKLLRREEIFKDGIKQEDIGWAYRKIVRPNNNGTTSTIFVGEDIKLEIVKDKKGNILSKTKSKYEEKSYSKPYVEGGEANKSEMKELASWYKQYLELCKEFGETPRICGVSGGAGDHYFELCMKKNNPEGYENYCKLREYKDYLSYTNHKINYLQSKYEKYRIDINKVLKSMKDRNLDFDLFDMTIKEIWLDCSIEHSVEHFETLMKIISNKKISSEKINEFLADLEIYDLKNFAKCKNSEEIAQKVNNTVKNKRYERYLEELENDFEEEIEIAME